MAAPSSVFTAIWEQVVMTDVDPPQYFVTDNKTVAVGYVEQIGLNVTRCSVGEYVLYRKEGSLLFTVPTGANTDAAFIMTEQTNILAIISAVP